MDLRKADSTSLQPKASHILRPSGDNIAMLDLKAPSEKGTLVKLTLSFKKAGPIEIDATVAPPGAVDPHDMDHQPGAGDENSGGKYHHS